MSLITSIVVPEVDIKKIDFYNQTTRRICMQQKKEKRTKQTKITKITSGAGIQLTEITVNKNKKIKILTKGIVSIQKSFWSLTVELISIFTWL
jgi:hypothetical protein